jgi:Fe2+ transport system protein FeoA
MENIIQSQGTFPLVLANAGESVRIISIRRGHNIQQRMRGMGIQPNDIVDIIQNCGHGSVLIAKGDNRFTLGGGMALKIQVIKEK